MTLVIGIVLYIGGLFLLAFVVIEFHMARKSKKIFWQHRYNRYIRVIVSGLILMSIAFVIACIN